MILCLKLSTFIFFSLLSFLLFLLVVCLCVLCTHPVFIEAYTHTFISFSGCKNMNGYCCTYGPHTARQPTKSEEQKCKKIHKSYVRSGHREKKSSTKKNKGPHKDVQGNKRAHRKRKTTRRNIKIKSTLAKTLVFCTPFLNSKRN